MELPYIDSGPTAAITARFLHNTIADNRGGTGGLYLDGYTTAFMTNTILAGHTYSALRVEASSTATLEATLWHGNGSLTYGDGTIISSTNVYSAPGFVDASTWDYHLAADSAAIDAGVDAGVPDDIDGDQRPVDGDLDGTAAMDIGADEVLVPVITLTKSAPAWFNLGTYITYTLRVTNTGLITGYNVILTDTLPAGSNFTWASDNGVEASDVVTWPAFSVPPNGGVVTRTFAVTAADTITNVKYGANAQGVPAVGGTVAVRTCLNHPPAADAGVSQTVAPGAVVALDGSGSSDPDGDALTYGWAQTGGTLVTLSGSSAISPTFTAPDDPTVLTFTLTITDSFGLSDDAVTTVTVEQYHIYLPLVLRSHH